MTVTRAAPSTLHDLACTGPTPATGCVCTSRPIRKPAIEQKHLDAGAARRAEAESLVRGTEVLLRKFATLPNVPLDLLDRMERAITAAHASNLLRVDGFSPAQLMATEGDEQ